MAVFAYFSQKLFKQQKYFYFVIDILTFLIFSKKKSAKKFVSFWPMTNFSVRKLQKTASGCLKVNAIPQ